MVLGKVGVGKLLISWTAVVKLWSQYVIGIEA